MFGMFKKKKAKSHLAMQIESKGLDQVTTEVVGGLMRQLSGTGKRPPHNKRMLSDWFSAALQTSRKYGR